LVKTMKLRKKADAFLPTRFGRFRVYAFVEDTGREHLALVRCDHRPHKSIPVRIHSRCLTGDTLTSLRCDCRDQLEMALDYLERKKCGMLIYMDQEGRGIGLANKIHDITLLQGAKTWVLGTRSGSNIKERYPNLERCRSRCWGGCWGRRRCRGGRGRGW